MRHQDFFPFLKKYHAHISQKNFSATPALVPQNLHPPKFSKRLWDSHEFFQVLNCAVDAIDFGIPEFFILEFPKVCKPICMYLFTLYIAIDFGVPKRLSSEIRCKLPFRVFHFFKKWLMKFCFTF